MDHKALKYMVNKTQLNRHNAWWVLLLHKFTFSIDIRPRKKHANADHMSHLANILDNEPINDALLDAKLFIIDVITSKYSELIQYLIFQIFLLIYSKTFKKNTWF